MRSPSAWGSCGRNRDLRGRPCRLARGLARRGALGRRGARHRARHRRSASAGREPRIWGGCVRKRSVVQTRRNAVSAPSSSGPRAGAASASRTWDRAATPKTTVDTAGLARPKRIAVWARVSVRSPSAVRTTRARASSAAIPALAVIGPSRPWRVSVASTPAARMRMFITPTSCATHVASRPPKSVLAQAEPASLPTSIPAVGFSRLY